jgi:hypothetical protein
LSVEVFINQNKQKMKIDVTNFVVGKIKFIHPEKGFGFIESPHKGVEDTFFHIKNIKTVRPIILSGPEGFYLDTHYSSYGIDYTLQKGDIIYFQYYRGKVDRITPKGEIDRAIKKGSNQFSETDQPLAVGGRYDIFGDDYVEYKDTELIVPVNGEGGKRDKIWNNQILFYSKELSLYIQPQTGVWDWDTRRHGLDTIDLMPKKRTKPYVVRNIKTSQPNIPGWYIWSKKKGEYLPGAPCELSLFPIKIKGGGENWATDFSFVSLYIPETKEIAGEELGGKKIFERFALSALKEKTGLPQFKVDWADSESGRTFFFIATKLFEKVGVSPGMERILSWRKEGKKIEVKQEKWQEESRMVFSCGEETIELCFAGGFYDENFQWTSRILPLLMEINLAQQITYWVDCDQQKEMAKEILSLLSKE